MVSTTQGEMVHLLVLSGLFKHSKVPRRMSMTCASIIEKPPRDHQHEHHASTAIIRGSIITLASRIDPCWATMDQRREEERRIEERRVFGLVWIWFRFRSCDFVTNRGNSIDLSHQSMFAFKSSWHVNCVKIF